MYLHCRTNQPLTIRRAAFLFIAILLFAKPTVAQVNTNNLLVHFENLKKAEYGKFGSDSITVLLHVQAKAHTFPSTYIVKGKLLGNQSGAVLAIPEEAKKENGTWTFSEYIQTASNTPIQIKVRNYASFPYSPFIYNFSSNPPNADIYIIPLENWKQIFHTDRILINFTSDKLKLVENFKVLKPTPCSYSVFEQPYIGVFVHNEKIKLNYIKPKRSTPADNFAEINF